MARNPNTEERMLRTRSNQKYVPVDCRAVPGDKMADGTILAGISPDTGKPMYTTPADVPLTMKWHAAMKYAANLAAHGHNDWRVPTKNEVYVLFNNRAMIGGFDVVAANQGPRYWSSTDEEDDEGAWSQYFSDGYQVWDDKKHDLWSLRCVRG